MINHFWYIIYVQYVLPVPAMGLFTTDITFTYHYWEIHFKIELITTYLFQYLHIKSPTISSPCACLHPHPHPRSCYIKLFTLFIYLFSSNSQYTHCGLVLLSLISCLNLRLIGCRKFPLIVLFPSRKLRLKTGELTISPSDSECKLVLKRKEKKWFPSECMQTFVAEYTNMLFTMHMQFHCIKNILSNFKLIGSTLL